MAKTQRSLVVLASLLLTVLLVPRLALAQRAPIDGMRFTTGFAFTVGDVTLPAGSYTVRRVGPSPTIFELINTLTQAGTLVALYQGDVPRQPRYEVGVKFERRGSVYLLSTLWDAPAGSAGEVMLPRGEPREAREAQPTQEVSARAIRR